MKKILWICSDLPFPATHGGRVDIWERIKKVSDSGVLIDLVCTVKDYEFIDNEVLKFVNRVIVVKRSNSFFNYIRLNPFQIESRKELRSIDLCNNIYDLLMLESEHVCSILDNKTFIYKKVALRIHNNEVKYFSKLASAENNLIYKFYYILDSLRLNRIRKKVAEKIDNYLFISKNEINETDLYNECGFNRLYHPTPFSTKELYIKKTEFKVLFVGSFFMVNNQEAIFWYLDEIHPKLKKIKDYRLILVGNDKNVSENFFTKIASYDNVEIHRSPKELDCFYKKSMIFINPMQSGAGVKLKTINAAEYSLPIVSTSVGAEGTGLIPSKDFLLANDIHSFYNAIIELYNSENLRKELCANAIHSLGLNDITVKQIFDILEG